MQSKFPEPIEGELMSNLFWKTKKVTKALLEKPFQSEEEFEKVIFETSGLLKDVVLLNRQVRGGGKSGIPDILGIDGNGDVCILEMKNVAVDSGIIPQVLKYAMWVETHPDAIKALWLENPDKPEDMSPDWNDFQIRI